MKPALKYSGRTFHISEFKLLDIGISTTPVPIWGVLKKDDEEVDVIQLSHAIFEGSSVKVGGIFAELVPEEETNK